MSELHVVFSDYYEANQTFFVRRYNVKRNTTVNYEMVKRILDITEGSILMQNMNYMGIIIKM